MNIFFYYQDKILKILKKLDKKKIIELPINFKGLTVELPPKGEMANISCNAALVLAKHNKMSPIILAENIKQELLSSISEIEKIDVAKPGFLNIFFKNSFWNEYLLKIINLNEKFGSNKVNTKKYNVEFVSANPTGPLHVGHCRGAILGDVLSNMLTFNGNKVIKEYYVNDYGGQLKNFVLSVYFRILEIKENKKFPNDENLYPGDYVIDIAQKIIKNNKIKNFSNFEDIHKKLSLESINCSMDIIKKNLKILGIKHNNFVHESHLVKTKVVDKIVKKLEKKKYVYKGQLKAPIGEDSNKWVSREQLLFKSTLFGDDMDRALQKTDKTWTYFAGDLGYHSHKISRKFDSLINILGADHAGYIKRIVSATKAISNNKINLICKVSQLVKLFKNGQPFKMSKRKGDYITVEDLVNEVGKDSARFMMLSRSNDVELDFDFQQVSEKSKDNPVFYVQYAYARINSVFRHLKLNLYKKIKIDVKKMDLNIHEIEIMKKISEWPKCLDTATKKLEPHRITFYLNELATLFHSYWNLGNENKKFRFISNNDNLEYSRLVLLQALAIVIRNAMNILGVSTPASM